MQSSLRVDAPGVANWRALRVALDEADPQERRRLLAERANLARRRILEVIHGAGLGHVGGDFSVIDILTCLYLAVARIDPAMPSWPERDRVVLSKGHASVSLYVTLARCGFFPEGELEHFAAPLSALNGHPSCTKVPGVEASTGPLGHGLPIAVGAALAARLQRSDRRVFVILGDGELQEGSNWEAAMLAGDRRLGHLTAVIDRNGLQQGARTEETNRLEPLVDKWQSFGWEVVEVDGHDHLALLDALAPTSREAPRCVVARTVKGKGVTFMEDRAEWHHRVPSDSELSLALAELSR